MDAIPGATTWWLSVVREYYTVINYKRNAVKGFNHKWNDTF